MNVPEFLDHLVAELEVNPDLRSYYRLLEHPARFHWRKAYLEQRLQFVERQLGTQPKTLLDVGCGYGSTAIFACLNGHRVKGTTLEFYFEQIQRRRAYWERFGDLSGMEVVYENLFDGAPEPNTYDHIIVQDTLHHLEPIGEACARLFTKLKPGGSLIVVEENGCHPFIRAKNFATRGFNRVGEIWDERLGKMIPFGNENARGRTKWQRILRNAGFEVAGETEVVRMLPPGCFSQDNYSKRIFTEQRLAQRAGLMRDFLFFGINFIAVKPIPSDHE